MTGIPNVSALDPSSIVDALNKVINVTNANIADQSSLTRAQIPSYTLGTTMIMVSGFITPGDHGINAIYTSQGATSGGPMAIQDASGTWFNLILSNPVNPGWFGAIGDGVTDDTAAINAALATGSVFLPPGIYKVTSQLTPISNSKIFGVKGLSIILKSANSHVFYLADLSNVEISGITIKGQRTIYTGTYHAIYVQSVSSGGQKISITDCEISDIAGAGIIVLGLVGAQYNNVRIENNTLVNIGYHPIICQGYINETFIRGNYINGYSLDVADAVGITTGRYASHHVVSDNYIIGTTPYAGSTSCHGISIDTATGTTVTGNTIENTVGYGIEVGIATDTTVASNVIRNGQRAAIAVSGNSAGALYSSHTSITGNTCYACNSGIYSFIGTPNGVTKHQGLVVSGNFVYGSTTDGITIFDTQYFGIFSNVCIANANYGIYVENTTDYGSIEGNACFGNNPGATVGVCGIRVNVASARSSSSSMVVFGVNTTLNNGSSDCATYTDGALGFLTGVVRFGGNLIPIRPGAWLGNQSAVTGSFNVYANVMQRAVDVLNPSATSISSNTAPNLSTSSLFQYTVTAGLAISAPTSATIGQEFVIEIIQGGSGGYAITWDSSFKFNSAWSDTGNTTGKRSSCRFMCMASGVYVQQGIQTVYV